VDRLLVVVEPGRRSIETALQVKRLAQDLGLNRVAVVGNKIRGPADREFLLRHLPDLPVLGFLPFDESVIQADLDGRPPYETSPNLAAAARDIGEKLSEEILGGWQGT
jgi:CO dehydrogenase maturation factor